MADGAVEDSFMSEQIYGCIFCSEVCQHDCFVLVFFKVFFLSFFLLVHVYTFICFC